VKTKKNILAILFAIGCATQTLGQQWMPDSIPNISSMDHLFYCQVRALFVGADAKTFVITEHRPDSYWDKEKIGRSELLVSYIDHSNITVIKKLDYYAKNPKVKCYNNKYYIFDGDIKTREMKDYYTCYIYNTDWNYSKSIELIQLPGQKGFIDFVVDKSENLYFATDPYAVNYKARRFTGNYIIKISPNGEFIKKLQFKNCIPTEFSISNDTLQLTVNKQGIESQFLYNDSILQIKADANLNYSVVTAKKFIPKDKKIDTQVLLSNGSSVVYIDSLYKVSPNGTMMAFKIALFDQQNIRKWTFEYGNRWIYSTPKPLKNGSFITKVDKRWDSTAVVVFDEKGTQRQIRAFLMNADTRIASNNILDFFEVNPNEIYLFYNKELPTRKEVLYFEKIKL
jgi:hypothetical protein